MLQNLFDERPFPNLCYRFFEEVSLHCLYRLLYPPHLCSCSGCPGFHTNYPVHSTHQQCLNLVNSSLCSVQSWGSEGPLTSSTSYLYFLWATTYFRPVSLRENCSMSNYISGDLLPKISLMRKEDSYKSFIWETPVHMTDITRHITALNQQSYLVQNYFDPDFVGAIGSIYLLVLLVCLFST